MPEPVVHLYAHIPFCPKKCAYCAFVTHIGSLRLVEPYLEALGREMEMVAASRPRHPLATVYFGGGTPGMLTVEQLGRLLDQIRKVFGLAPGAEITLEAHPDTVDLAKLRGYRARGVTRLSVGGESLDDGELRELGREHSAERVLHLVEMARQTGFDSLNIDLMYGIPTQTPDSWSRTLDQVLGAAPDHLSLYPLSIEPRTVFARRWEKQLLQIPDEDTVATMYHLACEQLRRAGYEHYEVANWARPGHRSAHNLAYWHNQEYFGVGVGAHGYLKPYRTENVPQTRRYINLLAAGSWPMRSREPIDQRTECNETVMLGLRLLQEGLATDEIRERFGLDLHAAFGPTIADLTSAHFLEQRGNRLILAEHAAPVANDVWSRFVA